MCVCDWSWRYYTSYDNGEWRRHATPMYKADAEQDAGIASKLAERRSASMTSGLTAHDDIIDIDDGTSSHSRPTSAVGRHQRLRGTACLMRDLPPASATADTDTGPTTVRSLANARGGSRILQGRVSNPSERGTGGRASKAPRGWGLGRWLCPLPRKCLYFLYQNGEFLCIPGDIY